jgi:hydroxyethylthiazole kinase-like uncharacterized protein yjeF
VSGAHRRLTGTELLTVSEMARADGFAVASGIPAERLMEAAGKSVADVVLARWSPRATVVLAGPGNNGGDGFVAARYLAEAGWPVRVALLGSAAAMQGMAALNAARWTGEVVPLSIGALDGCGLLVDGLFGAGLTRPLGAIAREVAAAIAMRELPSVAIDVPSGVHGDSGAVLGADEGGIAVPAAITVTFFRKKPGHLMLPGHQLCGELVVSDIGIPPEAITAIEPKAWENDPALWRDRMPWPTPSDHKYSRGHMVVCGGATMTGAARLAARAGQRAGTGLVSIAAPPDVVPIYAAGLLSVIVRAMHDLSDFNSLLSDPRVTSVIVGPGSGVLPATRAYAMAAFENHKACVLDADALSVFSEPPQGPPDLFKSIAASNAPCVLTPHEGEFARLFGRLGMTGGSKLDRARQAARLSGAIVVLKGSDTVIASPDGKAAINSNAPATLATAGTGDVLAGLIGGLLAQRVEPFAAACAAVWLQGAAAGDFGPGLIAEDVLDRLPAALKILQST